MKTQRATFNNPKPNAGWWSEEKSEEGKSPRKAKKILKKEQLEKQKMIDEISRIKEQEEIMMKQEL